MVMTNHWLADNDNPRALFSGMTVASQGPVLSSGHAMRVHLPFSEAAQ